MKNNNKHILNDLWENIKQFNIYAIRVPKGERYGAEKKNLNINLGIQETVNLTRMKTKETLPRYIRGKLLKTKN